MQGESRRYRVIEAVGRGGFGTVYKAALLGPGEFRKTVALKVLNPEVAEKAEIAARLRDEARMLGLLQHRAVVRVDGLQRLGDRWAVVMEFVEGVDLKRLLKEVGPMPVGAALEVMGELASALDSAYNTEVEGGPPLRLLHRDVKPSNVRLTRDGEVKVLDFGVARAEFSGRESSTESLFFGSLAYMAPERLDGIDTHKGDVYGCGAVLYELLVGTPLGRTSGNRQRHDACLNEALHKLWAVLPDEAVYRTVAACLAYDANDRPNAAGLARHVRSLRKERAGPWLQDWAREAIPAVPVARPEAVAGDLSGTILAEDAVIVSGSLVGSRRGSDRRGMRAMMISAAVTFSMVVLVGGSAVGWLWSGQQSERAAEQAELDALDLGGGAVVTGGELDPLEEPGAAAILATGPQEPAVVAPDAPAPEAAPSPTSPPVQSRPRPRPTPPKPSGDTTARVLIASGATAVRLSGRHGDFGAGAVPPGTYAIEADFGDGTFRNAGTVRVSKGEEARLACREALGRCRKR